MDLSIFPTINASLNALSFIFLVSGWKAIKSGKRILHQRLMVAALISSTVFLICYLTYHYLKHGVVTRYQGEGLMRVIYFAILLTHTPLAALIVPFCIAAVIFAYQKKYDKHVRITRWLMPAWVYVSVTGVLIYVMLYLIPV